MNKTKISWTDQTANPIRARNRQTGKRGWHCVKVSEGCKHCYAERMNVGPYGNGLPFREDVRADVELYLEPKVLEQLERQRSYKKTFLCDMTDLFQKDVPLEWIVRIWATMAITPNHTYQILTKRADRMQQVLSDPQFPSLVDALMGERASEKGWCTPEMEEYPLKNVWLGVSVENQQAADARIPCLLQTPKALGFLSCEPLLGAIELGFTNGLVHSEDASDYRVGWVICGGESGKDFRLMDLAWARSIRDQCVDAGVAFWFKQESAHRSETNPKLDGKEWHQFPE